MLGTLGDVVQAQLRPVFLPARGIRKGGRGAGGNHPEGRQPQAQAGLKSPENWAGACWGLKRKTTLAFQTALEQQVRWLKIQLGARPPRLAQLAANGSKFPRGQKARNCPFRLEERSEGRKGSGKALQERVVEAWQANLCSKEGLPPACPWADASSQYNHAFHKLFIDLATHQVLCWGLGAGDTT